MLCAVLALQAHGPVGGNRRRRRHRPVQLHARADAHHDHVQPQAGRRPRNRVGSRRRAPHGLPRRRAPRPMARSGRHGDCGDAVAPAEHGRLRHLRLHVGFRIAVTHDGCLGHCRGPQDSTSGHGTAERPRQGIPLRRRHIHRPVASPGLLLPHAGHRSHADGVQRLHPAVSHAPQNGQAFPPSRPGLRKDKSPGARETRFIPHRRPPCRYGC